MSDGDPDYFFHFHLNVKNHLWLVQDFFQIQYKKEFDLSDIILKVCQIPCKKLQVVCVIDIY